MWTLLYLLRCRLINSLKQAWKTPRLLIPGALLVFGLMVQILTLLSAESGMAGSLAVYSSNSLLVGRPAAFLLLIRGLLLMAVFTGLITALGEGNSFFDRCDVDFLFPSPLSRRSVLLFKMSGRYLTLLLPATYLPVLFAGIYMSGLAMHLTDFIPGILGSWFYLITVANLTQVILLRTPAQNAKVSERQEKLRQVLRPTVITIVVGSVCLLLIRGVSPREIYSLSLAVNNGGLLSYLLPDAWAADLFRNIFGRFHTEDLWRLFGLFALCNLSFVYLFYRDRDFYEAAMEVSVRRARITAAVRSGDAGAVLSEMAQEGRLARGFTLPDFGGGSRAVLWKDLVAATRIPFRNWLQLLIPAAFPALLGGIFGRESALNILTWTILYSLQMPGIFLFTLRDVLRRADISKSLPIAPWKLLAAELTLPLIQLTVLGWLSLTIVWTVGLWRGPLLPVAMLVLPSLAALLFLVQTIFILVYPDANDPAQHAVSGVLSLFVSLLAIAPCLIVGIPLFMLGTSSLILAAAVTFINLTGVAITLLIASRLWQRYETSI